MTTQEQFDQINAAIAKIENGAQEYRTGTGRLVRRGDLATLYKERRQLQVELANEQSSGGTYVAAYYRG